MGILDTQTPGCYFHVYNRAPNNGLVFSDLGSYLYFVKIVKENLEKYDISIISYCLMPNHFHILVRIHKEYSLSPFIRQILNTYVQGHNRFVKRTGPLFEGRTKYKLISEEKYLLQVSRYIHLNPVKANIVKDPAEWPYSNYLEWIGQRNGTLVSQSFIREYYPNPMDYLEFVKDGMSNAEKFDYRRYLLDDN